VAAVVALVVAGVPAIASASTPNAGGPGGRITSAHAIAALRAEVRDGTLAATHGSADPCQTRHLGCRYTIVTTSRTSTTPLTTAHPAGWGATALEQALHLTNAHHGQGLIVIVGIGAYPNLESDLNIYRAQYGIAPCTTQSGCLTIRNYKGGPALQPSDPIDEEDIAVETALDVQMSSAACPTCRIAYLGVPVAFGNDKDIKGFATAVKTAVRMGAASVSISYGFDTTKAIDTGPSSQALVQPGTELFSAVGDDGYMDPATFQTGIGGWPQNLRSVVSVGGTELTQTNGVFHQAAWQFAGSGCAPDLPAAYGQPASVAKLCNNHRAVSDVAAVSDNIAIYDTYAPFSGEPFGWVTVGGTSASSPFLAGMAARARRVNDALGPNVIYRAPAGTFTDITTGANGTPADCKADGVSPILCKAGSGWDGATGRGVPNGLAPFTAGRQ
jgi:subtilase family serine protease